MATTNLFVELIVIGIGSFAWVCLLLLALLGVDVVPLEKLIGMPAAAVPALAAVYLLGIVTDRLADSLFHLASTRHKHESHYNGGSKQYYCDRAYVLANSEQFALAYEYSRSRQRICRGWTLNSVAILICLDLLLWRNRDGIGDWSCVMTIASIFLAALAVACWMSWNAMSNTELLRIREQAGILSRRSAPSSPLQGSLIPTDPMDPDTDPFL